MKCEQGSFFFKKVANKGPSVESMRECNSGDIYSSETEYERSGSALGHDGS